MKPKTSNEQAGSHECDACGGTGRYTFYYPANPIIRAHINCPVCLGAGAISDRMPAADAQADASTLTSYLIGYGNPWKTRAAVLAWTPWPLNDDSINHYDVITAARAAFRAVPGLRG